MPARVFIALFRIADPAARGPHGPVTDLAVSSLGVDLRRESGKHDPLLSSIWLDDILFKVPEPACDLLSMRNLGLAVLEREAGGPWRFAIWLDDAWGRVYGRSSGGGPSVLRPVPVMELGAPGRPDGEFLSVAAACASRLGLDPGAPRPG